MKLLLGFLLATLAFNSFAEITKPLPAKNALAVAAKELGTRLNDENISTGTTRLTAGLLKTKAKFKSSEEFLALVKKGLEENFEEKIVVEAVEEKMGSYSELVLEKMVSAVMESNDYSPKNTEAKKAIRDDLSNVLSKLSVDNNTFAGYIKVNLEDATSGEIRSVQYFLILNSNGLAVQLFTIEGSM